MDSMTAGGERVRQQGMDFIARRTRERKGAVSGRRGSPTVRGLPWKAVVCIRRAYRKVER